MNLKEIVCKCVEWLGYGPGTSSCEHGNELSGSI